MLIWCGLVLYRYVVGYMMKMIRHILPVMVGTYAAMLTIAPIFRMEASHWQNCLFAAFVSLGCGLGAALDYLVKKRRDRKR